MAEKHTATPYKRHDQFVIKSGDKRVARVYGIEPQAGNDTNFIIRACNAYETNQALIAELVAVLKAAIEDDIYWISNARAAIAKATHTEKP